MKFKAALFFQDALVYYSIYQLGEGYYKAKLDEQYTGVAAPQLLELHRNSRNWNSDCANQTLVKELGAAIDQRTIAA